jgi:L-asparaginase
MGKYETSQHLQELGVIDGKDITTEAAITKAMFLLGKKSDDINWFKENFEKNLAGEMSN